MKKILSLVILLLFIVNTTLFAFENDLYKINDKGWENQKESDYLVFKQEDSKEFIDPETKESSGSDIYVIIRTIDFPEVTPDDFSQKNLEDFKKMFQRFIERSVNQQKEKIKNNLSEKYSFLGDTYLQKKVDKIFERTKINSYSVKKLGEFQSYYVEFCNENFNVKYYSLHTLNHRYQIQLYFHKSVSEDRLKPAYDFINSFVPKDVAPTAMNALFYGNSIKLSIVLLLLIGLVIYKIVSKRNK